MIELTPSLNTREQLGHYQLVKILGRGGMGVVYLAQDERLQRFVAIKRLKPIEIRSMRERVEYFKSRRRLQREARILAQLNHPNIVQIYDVIDENHEFSFVMEYVNGRTLKQQLKEQVTPFNQRITWLLEIAQGLRVAHDKGMIHKDLKLDNILIDEHDVAKISDFGIAHRITQEGSECTQTQSVLGSYSALSPEQALGQGVDQQSDLFSFGIIAFTVLFGEHPFGKSSNHNVMVQNILHKPPVSPSALQQNLPEALVDLLVGLLEKDKRDRIKSASEVIDVLMNCLSISGQPIGQNDDSQTLILECNKTQRITNIKRVFSALSYRNFKRTAIDTLFELSHRTLLILSTVIICFCILLFNLWVLSLPAKPLSVAVLPPSINQLDATVNGVSTHQKQVLIETLNTTLQQYLLETPGLHLISQQAVHQVSHEDYAHRATALGADVLIESTLNCQQQRCQVELNRIEQQVSSNKVEELPWTVSQQQQWRVAIDRQYLNLSNDVKTRISKMFPRYISNHAELNQLTEKEYQTFIEFRHQVLQQEVYNQSIWQALNESRYKYQRYLPYYELMSYLGRQLYDSSHDEQYLTTLNNLLEQGTEQVGNHEIFLIGLLEIELRRLDFEIASNIVKQLENLSVSEERLLFYKGLIENFKGNYEHANKHYQASLILKPTADLLYRIANNFYHQGEYKQVLDTLEQLYRIDSSFNSAKLLESNTHLMLGQFDKAISGYLTLVDIAPNSIVYNNLGLTYQLNNEYQKAIHYFYHAMELDKKNDSTVLNLADSLKLGGYDEDAEFYYQQIIESTDARTADWSEQLNLALAFIQLRRTPESLNSLHQSMRLSENHAEVLFNAGMIYALAKQWPVALSYMEQSLTMGVSVTWFHLPWFDGLCEAQPDQFNKLLASFTAENSRQRCQA